MFFDESEEKDLVRKLDECGLIVRHNVLTFDYLVIAPFLNDKNIISHYAPKTIDTFDLLKRATNSWIGLQDLAKLNLGKAKTLDAIDAPKMWRAGLKKEVREYCKNDVVLLKEIYNYGKNNGKLKYTLKNYGEVVGVKDIKCPW